MLFLHQLLYVLFTLHVIFMHFFGTNLLTRCHSASSCFLLFLYFRKVAQEIFSELDETKAKLPIFPDPKTESKVEMEEGQGLATPWGGAGHPLATPPGGVGPWSTL
jgi:hypothetical protein